MNDSPVKGGRPSRRPRTSRVAQIWTGMQFFCIIQSTKSTFAHGKHPEDAATAAFFVVLFAW